MENSERHQLSRQAKVLTRLVLCQAALLIAVLAGIFGGPGAALTVLVAVLCVGCLIALHLMIADSRRPMNPSANQQPAE